MSNIVFVLSSIAAAALFVWYTLRKNALTLAGALTAAFIGLWVLYFAGWPWLLPLFVFFISGTLLGRLNKGKITAADVQQGKARNAWQVLCNGGIYAALATAIPWQGATAQTLMLLSMSVATADTWSSEIGIFFRQATYDIVRLKRVPVGLSGGVSTAGTVGGLAGAGVMAVAATWLLEAAPWGLIFIGGFAGMLLDSIMGAAMQVRFVGINGVLTDRPGGRRYSGISWMSNDLVNLLSNAVLTASGFFLL